MVLVLISEEQRNERSATILNINNNTGLHISLAEHLLSEMTDRVMTDATPSSVVKTPLSWQTASPTIHASWKRAIIVGGQLRQAVSMSQQARFSTSRLWAVVRSDGVTTMTHPMARLPTTVTAAAAAIHATAALSNSDLDDDDVALTSNSSALTFRVQAIDSFQSKISVTFMTSPQCNTELNTRTTGNITDTGSEPVPRSGDS